jgi:hypothetical protein
MKTPGRKLLRISFVFLILLFSSYLCAAQTCPVSWTNAIGVLASGNSLTKTAGEGWGNAGASSLQSITSGDGYVEMRVSETNKHRMFGLSNGDSHQSYDDIDFALYPAAEGVLRVYEDGDLKGTFGPYAVGDVLRVAIEGGEVKYERNGALLYTSTAAPSYPLRVDTAFYSTSATISNAVISQEQQCPNTPYDPMQIFFDANNNTGFGTTSPIFNDDGVTGANVGKYFAIDGVTPGGAAYLGLGGFITNPTDRVGLLNFYNRAQDGVDGRTATIASYNDGALGKGNLVFATVPNNVGPIARMIIDSQGNVAINRPHAGIGATLALGGQSTNDTTYPLVAYNSQGQAVLILTSGGKLGIGSVNFPEESLQVGPSAQFSVNSSGRLLIGAPGEGIILKSPNGLVCSKLTINNSGALTTTIVTCPNP